MSQLEHENRVLRLALELVRVTRASPTLAMSRAEALLSADMPPSVVHERVAALHPSRIRGMTSRAALDLVYDEVLDLVASPEELTAALQLSMSVLRRSSTQTPVRSVWNALRIILQAHLMGQQRKSLPDNVVVLADYRKRKHESANDPIHRPHH